MDILALADYRERVARMFLSGADLDGFRVARDELFATHPQSAIPAPERAGFTGLRYFPANQDAIVTVPLRPADGELDIDSGGEDGAIRYRRVGILDTPWGLLTLWWIRAYGGGLFLPLRDGTCDPQPDGMRRIRRRPVPHRHGEGYLRPGPGDRGRRPGTPGRQLRVQPIVCLRRPLGLPARAAGKPGDRTDPGW